MTTTPTPAPAPMTARLRELLEEATEGEYSPQKMVALQMFMGFNAPTILRLLEAVEGAEKALEFIAAHKGKTLISTEHGEGYSHGANAGFEQLASAAEDALATLRAAREGA